MVFEKEKIGETGPTVLVAEHQLVVDWVTRHPAYGVLQYLNHRIIDQEKRCALYYIQGLGMGDGKRFALVHGQELFIFSLELNGRGEGSRNGPHVDEISIPEGTRLPKAAILEMIINATGAYGHPDIFVENAAWVVVPRKYSSLYWKEQARNLWRKHRYRVDKTLRVLRGILTGPLVATLTATVLLVLVRSGIAVPTWLLILGGIWLMIKLSSYDDEYFAGSWFVGVPKLRHGMNLVFRMQARLMNPQPLPGIVVKIEQTSQEKSFCIVKVTNKTFFPVPYLSISGISLADVVAPGFVDSLRAANKGAVNARDLEKVYVSLVKKWMLPRQTVQWQVTLLKAFPIQKLTGEVSAIVSISRYASGEERDAPTSFLLPVIV